MKPWPFPNDIIAATGDLILRCTPYGMRELYAIEHGFAETEYFDTITEAATRFHELAFDPDPKTNVVPEATNSALSATTAGMS